ncbi:alpha/beta hydrolase [Aquimarina sp. MMG016]|uniref:alpha/beta fold hydrolase n=1 Tax=Aquimarina sp. MMG016 TaxID=2822690 RepID=UPI001B3A53AF|nr:alpha/beta hydrolase [Aquimarina sp. MMG016]MBQ4819178.1 alpha/beta hydrolase [Aquimarina sp. MMG016]
MNLITQLRKKKVIFLLIITLLLLFLYSLVVWDIPVDELKLKYANQTSKFININGMDVHYRDEGQGIPIVLIHGTGASLHTWNHWADGLTKNYRVIRMDLPAFGLTGPNPSSKYSIKAYTDFVNEFLSQLQVDSCYMVGNSLGGHIAWNFVADYPDKVKKLILIDASGYPSSSEKKTPWVFKLARTPVINSVVRYITPKSMVRKNLEQVYFDDQKITDELVDRYYDLMLREGNRQAFIDRIKTQHNSNVEKLKKVNAETLVLWGADDLWIPLQQGQGLVNELPNAELVILENTGHVPMEESPDESLFEVIKFLAR